MEHEIAWCFVWLAVGSCLLALLALLFHPRQLRVLRLRSRPGNLVRGCVVSVLLLIAVVLVGLALLLV